MGTPPSWKAQADRSALQRSFTALVIAYADRFIHTREKNFAIADLARPSRAQNCLHGLLDHSIGQHHLDLCLRDQIVTVLAAAVDVGVSLLPSVSSHFDHRHALDATFVE